jgi:hypothetical protein
LVEPDPVVVRYVDPVMDTVRSAVSFRVEHRLEPFDMAGYLERRPDQRFDVVVLLNVAAEAFSAAQYVDGLHGLVRRLLAEKVKKGGLLVVVEPALKRFSRMLSEVAARHRQGGGEVWAPCVAAGTCPELARSDGFCFHSIPVPLSPVVQSISSRSGLKRHEVHFSYLSLLPKAKRMLESTPCGRAGQATASPSEGDTSGTSKEAGSIPGRVVSFPKRGGKGFTYWVCGPAGLLHAFAPPRIGGEDGIRGGRLPHGTIVEIALGEEAGRIG